MGSARSAKANEPDDAPVEGAPAEAEAGAAPDPDPVPPAAENAPPEDDAPIEVRILGDSDEELQKVPGSRALVTAKEIGRMGPRDTSEIIRRVPSLTVTTEDGHGLRLNVGMRGFDPTRSRSILVLEDGVPIAINPYGEPDLYYSTTVDRIRAVELVKGSGAVLFGPQTIAGVLNFLTPAPPDKRTVFTQLEAGQYGFFHALARYGDAVGDIRYLAQISFRRADGPRDIDLFALDFMGKVAFPVSDRGEMTIKVGAYTEESQSTYVGLTRDMFEEDPGQPTIAPNDNFDVHRFEISALHTHRFDEFLKLRTQVYAYTTDRVWRRQRYDRARVDGVDYVRVVGNEDIPLGAIYFRDSSLIRDRHYQVVGLEPQFEARFTTGALRHTLTFGGRFNAEFGQRRELHTDEVVADTGEVQTSELQHVLAGAAYVQDRIAFRDWLLVTPGVRLELAGYDRETLTIPIDGVPTDVGTHGTSTAIGVIPGLGMVLGTPDINGFAGIHLGWSPPRISSAVTPGGQDAELSAERSTNIEAGVRGRPAPGLSFEATGFLTLFTNQIVPATLSSGVQSELVNGGATRHAGVEAQVSVGIGELLEADWDLQLVGRYAFADARYRGGPFDGNLLPYAPQHHASALVDFSHPFGPGAQVSWSVVGQQFTDEANNELADATGRVGEIGAQNILDANARWTFKDTGLTVSLAMKNIIGDIYVGTRRPDGIHAAGFRQVIGGLRWEGP